MKPDDVQALVVMSFGGPEAPDEVMPFLRRVVSGRNVPDERLAQVALQYDTFGGVSPLNANNRELVARLRAQAPSEWMGERVYLANRNSPPFADEVMAKLAREGIGSAAVFVTSAFSSYSSCRQYREDLARGQDEAGTTISLRYLQRFWEHQLLRRIWADRIEAARPDADSRLLFVTHSLPVAMAGKYLPQHEELAAGLGGDHDWNLVFQSRSGPPQQPWLEPDIAEAVAAAAADGKERVIVAPIGFLSDNLEIRWDLDVTAGKVAADLGIGFERLDPPQSHPLFTDLIWDLFAAGDGSPCPIDCCTWTH